MKYRSFNSIILTVVFTYVFSTFGISVISHYCGGELQEVAFYTNPESCCGDEPIEDDGCCKNEEQHFSLHADFVFSDFYKLAKSGFQIIPFLLTDQVIEQTYSFESVCQLCFKAFDPPPKLQQQHIVSVSVLRI